MQLSPAKLAANGVRVCRTVQQAGEFVITFPRVSFCENGGEQENKKNKKNKEKRKRKKRGAARN